MARQGQTGFSLLEVLVAFSVLALTLGVLLQIFSTGLRGVTLGEQYSKAMLVAESRLSSLGSELPLEEGQYQDTDEDGYQWQVVVTPFAGEGLPEDLGQLEPLEVQVEVRWSEGERERSVRLTSLRVAGPEQDRLERR